MSLDCWATTNKPNTELHWELLLVSRIKFQKYHHGV